MFIFIFILLIYNDKKFAVDFVEMAFLLYLCLQKNDDLIMENKEQKNPIDEARRYVANAEENIARAVYDPETKSYLDSKYVKTCGLLATPYGRDA